MGAGGDADGMTERYHATVREVVAVLAALPDDVQDYEMTFGEEYGFHRPSEIEIFHDRRLVDIG